eukprot:1161037-Pelagomonas_calceolata.AAC.5
MQGAYRCRGVEAMEVSSAGVGKHKGGEHKYIGTTRVQTTGVCGMQGCSRQRMKNMGCDCKGEVIAAA